MGPLSFHIKQESFFFNRSHLHVMFLNKMNLFFSDIELVFLQCFLLRGYLVRVGGTLYPKLLNCFPCSQFTCFVHYLGYKDLDNP